MRGKPLYILVDSGSSHNFVDLDYAQKLGCEIESISPKAITVADGNVKKFVRISLGECKEVCLRLMLC